jgi:hypothetical protein
VEMVLVPSWPGSLALKPQERERRAGGRGGEVQLTLATR